MDQLQQAEMKKGETKKEGKREGRPEEGEWRGRVAGSKRFRKIEKESGTFKNIFSYD